MVYFRVKSKTRRSSMRLRCMKDQKHSLVRHSKTRNAISNIVLMILLMEELVLIKIIFKMIKEQKPLIIHNSLLRDLKKIME
jgi:hypothetical protein